MAYDPFSRGPHPVGVRTANVTDPARENRPLAVEVWYPATDAQRGQDTSEETRDTFEVLPGFPVVRQDAVRDAAARAGRHPLVVFSHGFGGHRRQSTFLCTHLASHGYVVASPDHTGNTIVDVMQMMLAVQSGNPPPNFQESALDFLTLRPADFRFVIDGVLDGRIGDVAALVDAEQIGASGHSFGGWTTLTTTAQDRRIRSALPLAPAGGSSPLPVSPLVEALDLRWEREVPTTFVVADQDSLLPLDGMRELLAKTPSRSKRMVVLKNADHLHFCDRIEEVHEMFRMMPPPVFAEVVGNVRPISELMPSAHAYPCVRAVSLAHMDATLKGDEAAAAWLASGLGRAMEERDIAVEVIEGEGR